MDVTLIQVIIMMLAGLFIGFSKTCIPSFGILSVTMMTIVFPAKTSVGLMLPVLIAGDLVAISVYRRKAEWKLLIRLIPWVLAGVGAGYVLLIFVSDPVLQTVIGLLILLLVILHITKNRLNENIAAQVNRSPILGPAAGILGGFATMIGNAAGGIMSIYFLTKNLNKISFVGTSAWFFFSVNMFKVPFFISLDMITIDSLVFNLWALPFVGIGAWLGVTALKHLPEKVFQLLILSFAAIGAIRLLL